MSDIFLLQRAGRAIHGSLGRGWQRAVARFLGVSDSVVSDIVRERRPLQLEQREALKRRLRR